VAAGVAEAGAVRVAVEAGVAQVEVEVEVDLGAFPAGERPDRAVSASYVSFGGSSQSVEMDVWLP
jgi:hypothetical protein